VAASKNPGRLFLECILGIASPSPILDVLVEFKLRPFSAILQTIEHMGGILCRDELIVGPLCLEDDRDPKAFAGMILRLKDIRGHDSRLEKAINELSTSRRIAPTTMGNYTRFPIAVLDWSGWIKKRRETGIYPKNPIVFLELTDTGRQLVKRIRSSRDIRALDVPNEKNHLKTAFSHLMVYQMSTFDLLVH
jgi:hypothetical protein